MPAPLTTIIEVTGKTTHATDRAAIDARIAACGATRVIVDLGAGDGLWAYQHARENTGAFVVAIDPVRENLAEASAKAAKKPPRGGAPNAMFVVAAVESPPDGLAAIADEVRVTLPWGSLMRGIILGDERVLRGIASLLQPGGTARIVLNTRIFDDPVPLDARDLPEVTPDYVRTSLTAPFAAAGIEIAATRFLDADEVAALGTTWAKRLSHRRPPRSVLIEAQRAGP